MRCSYVLAALLAVAGSANAQDKFSDLTFMLPPQANAATVIDVDAIYNSPLAQKENWAIKRPLPIPPTLLRAALASHMEPGDIAGGKWEIGVAAPRGRLTMEQLAIREKGALETIAGAQAVLSPRNVYFVEVRPWIIGMMAPADRHELSKWIREIRNIPIGVVRLDPFLKASVTSADRLTQFIMAIDLNDAMNPAEVGKELAAAPAFKGNPAGAAAASKLLGTAQGVKLTLMVTDAIHGELRLDFGESAAILAPVAKSLLTEFLGIHGAYLDSLEDWTVEAAGNAIIMRGPVREQGYRRILSLVAPPAPPADVADTPLGAEIKMLATTRYFQTVQTFLDDLRRPSRTVQNDSARFATWYDSFAQKIEQMPIYAVDEDVAKYGMAIAARLRGIASSFRGDLVDIDKLERTITLTPYIYATSGWGRRLQPGIWLQSNEGEVRARQQQAVERGTQTRVDLWSRIDNDTTAIAEKLAQRHKTKP
jgi:hypothetical protein